MLQNEYLDKHNRLLESWIQKYDAGDGKKPFVKDGIICPEIWFSLPDNNERILFILKEAYDSGKNSTDNPNSVYPRLWDLTQYIQEKRCTENCNKNSCSNCFSFRSAYNNIAAWTYAILTDCKGNPSYGNFHNNNGRSEKFELLKKVAVINLKKANGVSKSTFKDISEYAKRDAKCIAKQIEYINPTLIVCCGTYDIFNEHIKPFVSNNIQIISMPHPACRISSNCLYEKILKAY